MLLGSFAPDRAQMAAGVRPSNDVRVLEEHLGADVYDFDTMRTSAQSSRWARWLCRIAERTNQWSAILAIQTARTIRRYDVVYVSGEDIGIYSCLISRLLPGRSTRFIVRFERSSYGRTRWRHFVYLRHLRLASRGMDVAICRTSAIAQALRSSTSMPRSRVLAFGQEIDTTFFDPDSAPSVPPPITEPYILSAGLERRDYTTLLEAAEGLPIRLVIAAGSPWSKDQFHTTRELPANVTVGTYNHQQMRELYRHARLVVLCVLPTERACGMNVVGEAWAMRRPVIASATEGMSEYISSGGNGLLVAPGSVDDVRDAIATLLGSPDRADLLAANGAEYVRSTLSLDNFLSTVRRAIEVSERGVPTSDERAG
jgi:glycosyltransferase involved in cell wall biosynthesis